MYIIVCACICVCEFVCVRCVWLHVYRAKHPVKVHVWAGISLSGSTGICVFSGIMITILNTPQSWPVPSLMITVSIGGRPRVSRFQPHRKSLT